MFRFIFTLLLTGMTAGCATDRTATIDPDFGNAVRHNIAVQVINPEGVAEDDSDTMDGQKAEQAVERYRQGPAEAPDGTLVEDTGSN